MGKQNPSLQPLEPTQEMPDKYSSFHLIMLIKRLMIGPEINMKKNDYHIRDAKISCGTEGGWMMFREEK